MYQAPSFVCFEPQYKLCCHAVGWTTMSNKFSCKAFEKYYMCVACNDSCSPSWFKTIICFWESLWGLVVFIFFSLQALGITV